MSESSAYPHLFSPLGLAGKRLRNRVVHAAMSLHMGAEGRVTEGMIRYHENRARGGAGLIVTEPLCFLRRQRIPHRPWVWDDGALDGLKRWAAAVESHDCRFLAQVWDPGRGRHEPGRNADAIGASALPDDLSWTVPRPLAAREVRELIEQWAEGARRLERCGFSGVEISAGHGHLFHQFLSPQANRREDDFGGSREARVRILVELVAASRAACGAGFIVGIKLPGDDGVPGGIGPDEAAAIARLLAAARAMDYACFAHGAHARTLEMHVPDDYAPRMPYLGVMRQLRAAIPGVPVVALGRITDPAEAEGILARGEAEMAGLGRALTVDAAWPRKASQGRAHAIRYCVSCNTCWGTIISHRPIACDNNPRIGEAEEVDWWPARAPRKKRVVVVGSGAAGMEAAWVAGARGHGVVVFGRSGETGGKARLRALLPGGESHSSVYDYQAAAAQRAGVKLELGMSASLDDVLALKPDAVVLAAGATMIPPEWLGAGAGLVCDLREAMPALLSRSGRQPGTAVLFDMDHTEGTYAAAELLHARFARVVLVTPRESLAQDAPLVTRQGILRRMSAKRIETMVLAEPRWSERFESGELECENVYTGERSVLREVAFLAYATPRRPDDALAAPLRARGIEVHLAGDCRAPRTMLAATADGHAIGNQL
jgi:2,4-dienoyl-CoA reductase-like NADH-dependent reductase (Old Yellow Enzyme family)